MAKTSRDYNWQKKHVKTTTIGSSKLGRPSADDQNNEMMIQSTDRKQNAATSLDQYPAKKSSRAKALLGRLSFS